MCAWGESGTASHFKPGCENLTNSSQTLGTACGWEGKYCVVTLG